MDAKHRTIASADVRVGDAGTGREDIGQLLHAPFASVVRRRQKNGYLETKLFLGHGGVLF